MDEQFQRAEQQYFELRGRYEAGRNTRQELEAALKDQMVRDAQGRYWTLGIDSGKWYNHDGKDWVQADPDKSFGAVSQPSLDSPPAGPPPRSGKSNPLPILAALGCLAIICLAAIAGAAYIFLNPAAPRPTLAALANPTSGVIVTTATFGGMASPTSNQVVNVVATATSEPTVTPIPPTDTPNPIPASTVPPAFPPGFYVTALRPNPPKPVRRQDFFFDVRFVNTAGGSRTYRWLVYVYRSDPSQQKNSLGETPSFPFTFPSGSTNVEIGTWRLTGAGGCEDFVARVAWLDDARRPTFFTRPDGQVFEQAFQVCP